MFINTMAVGPLLPVESCVTGGTGVANVLDCKAAGLCHDAGAGSGPVYLEIAAADARLVSRAAGFRNAIVNSQ